MDASRRRQIHDAGAQDGVFLRAVCLGAGTGGRTGHKGCGLRRGSIRKLLAAAGASGFVLRVDETVDQVDIAAGNQWRQGQYDLEDFFQVLDS